MISDTKDVSGLLESGLFDIPSYQRGYAWQEPQWEDMLEDLIYLPEGQTHFFGNVVLEKLDERFKSENAGRLNRFNVVDGQQRLTTTIIALASAAEIDEDVATEFGNRGFVKPISERPRLVPQGQDREFFRDAILGDSSIEPQTPSQRRLTEAQKYFRDSFKSLPDGVSPHKLADRLLYDCRVNILKLNDEAEAASIFETLNDRGRSLSSLEKTKSFLMYMDARSSDSGKLEEPIQERFGGVYRKLDVIEDGHDKAGDFDEDSLQRYHWGIYDGYDSNEYSDSLATLKSRLRKKFRAQVSEPKAGNLEAVQTFIDDYSLDLRQAASAFSTIFRPRGRTEALCGAYRRLLRLGRVANVIPVLMASEIKFGGDYPNLMRDIVKACETLSFRVYAIDRRRSDSGRSKLVDLAHEIHSKEDISSSDVVSRLHQITADYANDDRFRRDLEDPELYKTITSGDLRYLLFHFDEELETNEGDGVERNLESIMSREFEVEHILARNLDNEHIPENLRGSFDDRHVHRLGNLTIASSDWNKRFGNKPFEQKREAGDENNLGYGSSGLRVQQQLGRHDRFGLNELEAREESIIEFALECWSIN